MANAIVYFIRCHRHFTQNRRAPFQDFLLLLAVIFLQYDISVTGTLVYTYCTGISMPI